MLPEMSGYDVLLKLRENNVFTPVLILTAKDTISDKLKGFRYGADDYLVKPFETEELIARLEAIIRRTNGNYNSQVLEFKDMQINLQNRQVLINGKEVILQGKQFDILEYLITSKNTIVTKEQIFDKIWGFDSYTTTNVVEVYASGLRKTLKKYGYDKYIKTVRGVGYIVNE
jgi:two-component system response regulator CiaR